MAAKSRVAALAQIREMTTNGEAKRIRLASKLAITEIAAEIPAHVTTVFYWENGQRAPRGEPALAYLRILLELDAQLAAREGTAGAA